jgi:hypothetical protein
MATSPGITLPRPDWTRPGPGLGCQFRYLDRVFASLLVPGLDLMYPDRTKCTYIWKFVSKYMRKLLSSLEFLLLIVCCTSNLVRTGCLVASTQSCLGFHKPKPGPDRTKTIPSGKLTTASRIFYLPSELPAATHPAQQYCNMLELYIHHACKSITLKA